MAAAAVVGPHPQAMATAPGAAASIRDVLAAAGLVFFAFAGVWKASTELGHAS